MVGICRDGGPYKQRRGYTTALYCITSPKHATEEQETWNMTLQLQYYFVLTSCPCDWAIRSLLFHELSKAGHLSSTKANLLDVRNVQVLRDELTCKKDIKDTYKI